MTWSLKDMPSLTGKLAVVTGASGGLGLVMAQALADHGANVIGAARNRAKGTTATSKIGRNAQFIALDLADLTSVKAVAAGLVAQGRPIDLLINNAGLAAPRTRLSTRDGFETQFGTNFLGHFALTALLMPMLRAASDARVVTVASIVEKSAKLNFDDLQSERAYSPTKSYGQSKLANLLFARELDRRSRAGNWGVMSVAAHPGMAITELTKPRPGQPVIRINVLVDFLLPFIGHDAASGALPILYAATAAAAAPGDYYGPTGFLELKGPPGPAKSGKLSRDVEVASRLWAEAEQLTGVPFP